MSIENDHQAYKTSMPFEPDKGSPIAYSDLVWTWSLTIRVIPINSGSARNIRRLKVGWVFLNKIFIGQ